MPRKRICNEYWVLGMQASESENTNYEEIFINTRGMNLFTRRWVPANQEPKGLVFICHGYAMECTRRIVKAGFGEYGIDYEGMANLKGLMLMFQIFTIS
ncbi:unnamed protein product [Arabis nemorensis]|uniref:Uncharacterized protein n=1 Tax=Arabis nemorensis TaxID=586526 RepID=A0A565BJJ2_9BRAS|nr:unnamed protein product [Arabis nemorensis]